MSRICNRCYTDNDYPVDLESDIKPTLRWTNANTTVPPMRHNGGLYSGPQNNAPYMPRYVPPTSTYFMQVLLKSANPPPGAIEQYPTENRLGNNYTAMPNVHWFNSAYDNKGPYNIKVIKRKEKGTVCKE